MSIKIDKTVYLNLPEQVEKNRVDILDLKGQSIDITDLTNRVDGLNTSVTNLDGEVDTLKGTVGLLGQDLQTTKGKVTTNTNNITQLQNDVNRIDPIIPTDITVRDNKLGLEHDTNWLTNQNAINLGSNLTYDVSTNTLNAIGGGSGEITGESLMGVTKDSDTVTRILDTDGKVKFNSAPTVDAYTKAESDAKYQPKGDYALKSDIPTDFYTKAESDENYQPKGTYVVPSDLDIYEKKSDLNTTLEGYVTTVSFGTTLEDYALKTEIPTDFYTRAQSDEKYQLKGDYVTNASLTTTLSDYALKTEIPTDFYTKAQSDDKYQTKADASTTTLRTW